MTDERKDKDEHKNMDDDEDVFEENEEDYEDDEDADIGEQLTEEKLKEMGIDIVRINEEQGPDEDNRSWVSTDEVGGPHDEMSDDEANLSVQSYSDKIRKVFLDHTDAIMALEIVNGNVFTGGMDDRLVKWKVEKSEDAVDSKKVSCW